VIEPRKFYKVEKADWLTNQEGSIASSVNGECDVASPGSKSPACCTKTPR